MIIIFKRKHYGISTDTAKGAGIGAALAVGANKIMNSAIGSKESKWVTEKVTKVTRKSPTRLNPNEFGSVHETFRKVYSPFETITKNARDKVTDALNKPWINEGIASYLNGANRLFWDKLGKLGAWIMSNPGKAAIAGAAIGASLAAGYYLIKAAYNKADQKLANTSGRMLDKVCKVLEKMGYKRNQDFTTDPVQADYLKTKVCIVVSSTKDELNITVNSINDPKLEPVARQIIKNLPSGSKFYQRQSDKSNELTLAVTGSNNGDHTYIATVVERFIKKKYPVFILEIN